MRDVRVQYFLSYGVLGTTLPYASVFFRHQGFTQTQVGYAWAVWSGVFILSPVLVTLAADLRADPRRLMALGLTVSGLTLAALAFVSGVGATLAIWTLHCLATLPMMPLQDGICFSLQRRQEERGETARPFHRVRVWGTYGFMVPSVVLFGLLYAGVPVNTAMVTGAVFAFVSALQALRLDDPRAHTPGGDAPDHSGLPTLGAARVLLRPNMLVFCAAIFLAQMASTIYAAFYPVYLTEQAKVPEAWVGLVSNLGVAVEIFFILACGWFTARLGVKWVLVVGTALVAVRMALLMGSAHPAVAIGTQLFHGIQVVALGVMPQTFVNAYATDRYRHSMQGVWVMLLGCGRAAGSLTGGPVAEWGGGQSAVFAYAAILCAASSALALLLFRDPAAEVEARVAAEPVVPEPAVVLTGAAPATAEP